MQAYNLEMKSYVEGFSAFHHNADLFWGTVSYCINQNYFYLQK